ncbi:MAG: hypothetical protein MR508_02150 [Lachnospiraceae bacterium]|nr:hypothetical protein [Lachnospiraceae bacterium]
MVEKDEVIEVVNKIKYAIQKELSKENVNHVLSLISTCARLLYETNLYYMDQELEDTLKSLAHKFIPEISDANNNDVVIFYDGFGLNERGLAQIYLKALCRVKKVYYVTYSDRKKFIPDILDILKINHGEADFIDRNHCGIPDRIMQLQEITMKIHPKHFFFYSTPDDVVATTVLYSYENRMIRYQINLTDHAFWLGAHCIDKCIEFRPYGAKISNEYRKIPQEKIVVVPFYPIIHYEKSFDGYPFTINPTTKVVFSGGALYKTLGKGNKYYQIVDYILENNQDAVFWYAGSGDRTEMDKLIEKYPNRLYLTEERTDLFQVLQHCYFYLSTYPLCGGLMFQYAAMAEKVPITLREGNVTDDFLIDQDMLGIQFDDIEDVKLEIDHLMKDKQYVVDQGRRVKESVIKEDTFDEEIECLINGAKSHYPISYEHIDTVEFRSTYLDNLDKGKLNEIMVRRDNAVLFMYAPLRFTRGVIKKVKNRVLLSHKS